MRALPPGVNPGQPIEYDVFLRLPRLPGWRYELVDGKLRVQPDGSLQVLRKEATPDDAGAAVADSTGSIRVVPWVEVSGASVVDVLDRAFYHSVDYWGWPDHKRRESLQEVLSVGPDAGSSVALTDQARIVGALLTARGAGGPYISVLGVEPAHRQRGVASAMLGAACRAVHAAGSRYLYSSHLVASTTSALWHYASGFEDIPTAAATASRLRAIRWELSRTPPVSEELARATSLALRDAEKGMRTSEDVLRLVMPV